MPSFVPSAHEFLPTEGLTPRSAALSAGVT